MSEYTIIISTKKKDFRIQEHSSKYKRKFIPIHQYEKRLNKRTSLTWTSEHAVLQIKLTQGNNLNNVASNH